MIPTFPSGATARSLVLAFVQAGRLSSLNQKIVGRPVKEALVMPNRLRGLAWLAEHVFFEALTQHDLLLHHTVAPLYLSLSRSPSRTSDMSWWYQDKSDVFLSAYRLRLCPQCVEEDTGKFGCGHWRREHQISSVLICTKHLTPLHEQCATPKCGASFSKHVLPGQPCPSCQGTGTSSLSIGPISRGYIAYCKLFTDALIMRIPELDPDNRLALCRLPHELSDSSGDSFDQLLGAWLGNQWGHIHAINAWNDALAFLRNPYALTRRLNAAPALILLASLKRAMYGPPPDSEAYLWSDYTG